VKDGDVMLFKGEVPLMNCYYDDKHGVAWRNLETDFLLLLRVDTGCERNAVATGGLGANRVLWPMFLETSPADCS